MVMNGSAEFASSLRDAAVQLRGASMPLGLMSIHRLRAALDRGHDVVAIACWARNPAYAFGRSWWRVRRSSTMRDARSVSHEEKGVGRTAAGTSSRTLPVAAALVMEGVTGPGMLFVEGSRRAQLSEDLVAAQAMAAELVVVEIVAPLQRPPAARWRRGTTVAPGRGRATAVPGIRRTSTLVQRKNARLSRNSRMMRSFHRSRPISGRLTRSTGSGWKVDLATPFAALPSGRSVRP